MHGVSLILLAVFFFFLQRCTSFIYSIVHNIISKSRNTRWGLFVCLYKCSRDHILLSHSLPVFLFVFLCLGCCCFSLSSAHDCCTTACRQQCFLLELLQMKMEDVSLSSMDNSKMEVSLCFSNVIFCIIGSVLNKQTLMRVCHEARLSWYTFYTHLIGLPSCVQWARCEYNFHASEGYSVIRAH